MRRASIVALATLVATTGATTARAQATAPMAEMAMRGMSMDDMTGALGAYPMAREGSGTSSQPDATPMEMLHVMNGGWALMLHGFANLVEDRQTGPRGGRKMFSESMLMLMADRPLGSGALVGALRAPAVPDGSYGRSPMSYLVFLQARVDPR